MSTLGQLNLRDRNKLAFDWLPDHCERLLDGGCAWGYATATYAPKAKVLYGCDPSPEFIERGRKEHPEIHFDVCPLEKTPYPDESFDAITVTDVLEHVADDCQTLNELFRILRPGGSLIITTPHKGLFSFMDTENYAYYLRTKLPGLHRWMFRMKHGRDPVAKVGYSSPHRHYSLKDYESLLENSAFKGHFKIEQVFYGGLFWYALSSNLFEALSIVTGLRLATLLTSPIQKIADWDFFINYGKLSYNIGLLIKKNN